MVDISEKKYGVLMSIMTQADMGFELMSIDKRVLEFSLISNAVLAAKEHAEMEGKLVPDWVYDIVELDKNNFYGKPIETYHSVPRFERVS